MYQVNVREAQQRFPELMNAILGGETVFITPENEEARLQLVVVRKTKRRPQFGSAKGLITMADDFDAPLSDFKEYLP